MAFTYNVSTDRGRVRLAVGDVTAATAIFDDDEIDYFLSTESGNVSRAAAMALETLAQRYATKASFSADGLSVQWTANADACRAQAKELRKRAGGTSKTVHMTRKDGYSDTVVAGS